VMSKHPYDWIIHFILVLAGGWHIYSHPQMACFTVSLFIIFMIEYEQKSQVWYDDLTWADFIQNHALGDILAGILALIVLACFIFSNK